MSQTLPSLWKLIQYLTQIPLCPARVHSLLWSRSCNLAWSLGDGLLWVAFLPLLRVIPDIYGGCVLTSSASFLPNLSVLPGILRTLSPHFPFPVSLLRGQGRVFSSLPGAFQSTWLKAVIIFLFVWLLLMNVFILTDFRFRSLVLGREPL